MHQLWLGEAVPKTEARMSDKIICAKCHVVCGSEPAGWDPDGVGCGGGGAGSGSCRWRGGDVIMRALCSPGKGCRGTRVIAPGV